MKNPNLKSIGLVAALLALLPTTPARAGAEGHGGEIVDYQGKPTLRDLVEQTNCEFFKLSDMTAAQPRFGQILDSIRPMNWYLAQVYAAETDRVTVCQTEAPLKQVATNDADGVAILTETDAGMQGNQQIAVRLNDQVYLDMSQYRKLSAEMQAYVLFHEETHSFIPLDAPMRNTKLRSFVAYVQKNEAAPESADHFALQMQQNDLTIPSDFAQLDKEKAAIQTALDTTQPQSDRITAALQIRSALYAPDEQVLAQLGKLGFNQFGTDLSQGDGPGAQAIYEAARGTSLQSALNTILLGNGGNFQASRMLHSVGEFAGYRPEGPAAYTSSGGGTFVQTGGRYVLILDNDLEDDDFLELAVITRNLGLAKFLVTVVANSTFSSTPKLDALETQDIPGICGNLPAATAQPASSKPQAHHGHGTAPAQPASTPTYYSRNFFVQTDLHTLAQVLGEQDIADVIRTEMLARGLNVPSESPDCPF